MAAKGHPNDEVIYSLKKFVALAAECNPNFIEVLHGAEEDILTIQPAGRLLLEHRHAFISKQAKPKFAGYARAQLKRIKTHRSWLLSPPTKKPERGDFGLGTTTKISKSELGAFDALIRDGVSVEMPKDVVSLFVQERGYQAAMRTWDQYEGWKKNRNEARAQLEAVAGYDTKHGMHLMRRVRHASSPRVLTIVGAPP
jgi:predicted nucleotidyltransferase